MAKRSDGGTDAELYFAFGEYCLDVAERSLRCRGEPVALTEKEFQLLRELVQARGRVLARDELMQRLWPDTAVEGNILAVNVSTLRKALGDSAAEARYIQTLPRRGYRFVAAVRGLATPGGAVAAEGSVDSRARRRGGAAAFVGREAELALLRALVTGATQSRTAFVMGDAGIGKTTLCQRLLAQGDGGSNTEHGLVTATGRCLEHCGEVDAYLPFVQALGALLCGAQAELAVEIVARHAPSWCRLFPTSFDATQAAEAPAPTAGRMLRELADALGEIGRHRPLVLLIEDLHWADPSSLDLIRYLADAPLEGGVWLVCTLRSGQVESSSEPLLGLRRSLLARGQSLEISLDCLSEPELVAFLDQRFHPNDFARELARALFRVTGGHPLFATRYAEALAARGELVQREGSWVLGRSMAELQLDAPPDVLAFLRTRLAALGSTQRRLLQHASVQGESFDSALLAELLEAPEVEVQEQLYHLDTSHRLVDTLDEVELTSAGSTTRYRFAHALYQQVLYADLVNRRRTELHLRTATLLGDRHEQNLDPVASELALHFERGRDFSRAIELHVRAAGHTVRQCSAMRESSAHLTRAMAWLPRLPPGEASGWRYVLHWARGWSYVPQALYAEASRDFSVLVDEALAIERAAPEPGQVALRRAVSAFEPGAGAWWSRAPSSAVELQLEALFASCLVHLLTHGLEPVRLGAERMLALAESIDDEARQAEALTLLANAGLRSGALEAALAASQRALRLARPSGHRRARLGALHALGLAYYFRAEYAAAEAHCSQAQTVLLELPKDAFSPLDVLFSLGFSQASRGYISSARLTFEQASERARLSDNTEMLARSGVARSWLLSELGLGTSDEGEEPAPGWQPESRADVLMQRARNAAYLGDGPRAQELLRQAEQTLELGETPVGRGHLRRCVLRLRAARCRVSHALGNWQALGGESQLLYEAAAADGARKYMALALDWRAAVAASQGDPARAAAELRSALGLFDEHPAPLVTWRLWARLSVVLLELKDGNSAARARSAAASGIAFLSQHCDDELRAAFARSPAVVALEPG